MRITYSTTLLAAGNPALRRLGPSAMVFNGSPVLDVAQLFRAANATVFGRGDGPVEFAFNAWADFDTEADALLFCGTHRESLPLQAALTLVDDAGTLALVMAQAVRAVRIASVIGQAVLVAYHFTGAKFVTGTVPGPTAGDTDIVKAVNQALTAATTSQAITFDLPFASPPRGLSLQLSAPDGGTLFGWQIRESSRTAAGFTVDFDAPVPASGYKLTGIAVL